LEDTGPGAFLGRKKEQNKPVDWQKRANQPEKRLEKPFLKKENGDGCYTSAKLKCKRIHMQVIKNAT